MLQSKSCFSVFQPKKSNFKEIYRALLSKLHATFTEKMPVNNFLSRVMGHEAHHGLSYCLELFFIQKIKKRKFIWRILKRSFLKANHPFNFFILAQAFFNINNSLRKKTI